MASEKIAAEEKEGKKSKSSKNKKTKPMDIPKGIPNDTLYTETPPRRIGTINACIGAITAICSTLPNGNEIISLAYQICHGKQEYDHDAIWSKFSARCTQKNGKPALQFKSEGKIIQFPK